ncbi:hypothetical protein EV144_10651 [Flavobacterium sp. 270]|uniref:hypothetical protein n=1 Tax=Flavobacterium sp. 270 TaxID=2512114 RepID=UPI001066B791|nr:hypothetical protein [Flavobacterium sp. 270]TDW46387.1 hypothetical protein EV144_10651 [Flavobacterium sp. 270]
MIKKFLLLSLVVSQLTISCSSDESASETDQTLAEQIANIVKQPYSKLTPTEQKVKLESEANEMLVQLDKSKTSSAIEALENLTRLLDLSSVDIFSGKNENEVEDILNVSGVYGIYTWNNTGKKWTKTASTTELKFVFPAKESQTANNASFSSKAVSSDIKVKVVDTYDWQTDVEINDFFFLPLSADAVLTIDNVQAATFNQTAKYANGKEIPNEFAYKMSVNDGYAWEMSSTKATENTAKASLTYNGKNLIEFNSGSTAQIDALIDNDELVQYRGKANGLFKLMDNFVIVADMDLATQATDDAALEKTITYPNSPDYQSANADYKAYYTAENTYNQKYSEGHAASFNKNLKFILVSKKDGTKIADVVQHAEVVDSYNRELPVWNAKDKYWSYNGTGGTFVSKNYDEVLYLKFSDNTEVEMSAYFSEGFDKLTAKFEDFIAAFEK